MKDPCDIPECPSVPAIIVRDTAGGEVLLCRGHWQDMLVANSLIGEVVNVVDALADGTAILELDAECFREACKVSSVNIIRDPDGSDLPVCLTHWDDLSWVRASG